MKFECPKCGQKMILNYQEFRYDTSRKPKKKYIRKAYWCKKDDVWISLEIPTKSINPDVPTYATSEVE